VGRAIFISYRRDDTEGEAGRLFDDLVRTFGDDSVFMDVAGINPGIDFRKAIDDNVATCGVLLAMIGPGWATITSSSGERRLDDANDFVRLEVASALARNIAVIPVLVHDAKMPRPDQLPDNLKDLAYRNSVEITHARWNSDVQLLTKALGQYVASSSYTNTEPVHATVSVQLPPPNAPAERPAPAKGSKMPLIAGVGAAVIVAIGVAAFFALHHSGSAEPSANLTTPVAAQGGSPSPASGAQAPPAVADWAKPMMGAWVADGANAMTGTSQDPSPNRKANELARLEVSGQGDQISIHAWGGCHTCDWGTQTAVIEGGNKAAATWDLAKLTTSGEPDSGRVAHVTMNPDGDKLSVLVQNTYSNRTPSKHRSQFDRVQ
jgi:TIR domain